MADVNSPGQEERKCSFLKGDPVPQDEGWERLWLSGKSTLSTVYVHNLQPHLYWTLELNILL